MKKILIGLAAIGVATMTTGIAMADDETTTANVGDTVYVTDYGSPLPGVRLESNDCEGMQAHDDEEGCEGKEADTIVL